MRVQIHCKYIPACLCTFVFLLTLRICHFLCAAFLILYNRKLQRFFYKQKDPSVILNGNTGIFLHIVICFI